MFGVGPLEGRRFRVGSGHWVVGSRVSPRARSRAALGCAMAGDVRMCPGGWCAWGLLAGGRMIVA